MTKLHEIRKKLKLSQKELAIFLGVSQSSVSRLDRRGIIKFKMAKKYAFFLKCEAEELIEDKSTIKEPDTLKKRSRLCLAREKAGLRQLEFAASCGVSQNLLSIQEKSGIKSIRVAKRYADALNCNPLDLLEI